MEHRELIGVFVDMRGKKMSDSVPYVVVRDPGPDGAILILKDAPGSFSGERGELQDVADQLQTWCNDRAREE